MSNASVAQILYEIAELLDIKGDVFKRNAYRQAAQSIENLDTDVREYYDRNALLEIPGVGEGIAKKIGQIVDTGESSYLDDLRKEFPPGFVEMTKIPDIGPKTLDRLRKELQVNNIEDLKKAALGGRIRRMKGFGVKSEENILRGIDLVEKQTGRMLLSLAYPISQEFLRYMKSKGFAQACTAGSLRRMRETVGDIDLLVGSNEAQKAMDDFASHPYAAAVIVKGMTKTSVRLANGVQVDLRVVPPESYGAALQYFTGSKEHNVELRRLAIRKGLKLNEYGVFEKESDRMITGRTEEEVYSSLGLNYIAPELRENRGEIEAAHKNSLPPLVNLSDIKGDLHIHTPMSDGKDSMEDMIAACQRKGYEYLGFTDHSQSLKIANGLSEDRLLSSIEEVRKLAERTEGIKILRGAEVDILEDGSLDYSSTVLRELDYVIGSVHSRFKMSRREMTERIIKAMSNDYLSILGHPTGRLIGQREAYELDMDLVMNAAEEKGVVLELNSSPNRLDLNDSNCIKAKGRGIMLCVNTDAHYFAELDNMFYGVATARRGWLEARDVLNTRGLEELMKILHRAD